VYYPWNWETKQDMVDVALSTYADDFLGGDHEFRFGVSYGRGKDETTTAGGVSGRYYYRYEYTYEYYGYEYTSPYYYRVTGRAYTYGSDNEALSAYADDSWRATERLTINLGVRADKINSDIPAYPMLDRWGNETGEIIPGEDNLIDWTHYSPRIGFAYQIGENGVLRGFYGKFFDSIVSGNWINAEQELQNQRRHALQVQGNFDLPWKFFGTVVYSYLSGKPYNRQVTAGSFSSRFPLEQGGQTVIAVPATGDTTFSDQNVLDLSFGRVFDAGPVEIQVDLQFYNIFNSTSHDSWQTLIVAPGDDYYPRSYVLPRSLGLHFGIHF